MLTEKVKKIMIQIILILISIFTIIINISTISYAKYVYNYTITAAEIECE